MKLIWTKRNRLASVGSIGDINLFSVMFDATIPSGTIADRYRIETNLPRVGINKNNRFWPTEKEAKEYCQILCNQWFASLAKEDGQYEPQIADTWIKPKMKGYRMMCCDCGLIHELDFQVVKILERRENGEIVYEVVGGHDYEIELMARRIDI